MYEPNVANWRGCACVPPASSAGAIASIYSVNDERGKEGGSTQIERSPKPKP